MIEMWLILAGALTVLYAMLVVGPWKTNPLYLPLCSGLLPLPLLLPWPPLFTGLLLLRLIELTSTWPDDG
jgi:hypothetical protein